MTRTEHAALRSRLDELADDIGRLRRRLEPDTSTAHLADRIADHIRDLHQLLEPTAAQLAATTAPGDEQAIHEAILIVDERTRRLGGRLAGAP